MLRVEVLGEGAAEAVFAKASLRSVPAVIAVVNRAAIDTQTLAKRLAPVDTGRLRASIRPRFYALGLSADVFTDVEYAVYQEFGTRDMPAQPFLHPAWETIRPYYLADMAAAVRSLAKGGV